MNNSTSLASSALANTALRHSPKGHDRWLFLLVRLCALLAAALLLLIVAFVATESGQAIQALGARLFTDSGWFPGADASGQFNLTPMIVGSLLVALLAMAISLPIAVASVLFVHSCSQPWLVIAYRRAIELLAGIPSVVFGLWGLVVIVPLLGQLQAPGTSILAGALVLALMILPTIALLADSALRAVPNELRLGGLALGLSPWRVVLRIQLLQARSGVIAGAILGLGRALGETMVVLMVCGNVVQLPTSIMQPIRTLTANIALEMAYAGGLQRSALFVSGLLLIALVVALIWSAHRMGRGYA